MKKIFVEFPYGDTILKTKENVEERLVQYKDLIEENYIFEKHLKLHTNSNYLQAALMLQAHRWIEHRLKY